MVDWNSVFRMEIEFVHPIQLKRKETIRLKIKIHKSGGAINLYNILDIKNNQSPNSMRNNDTLVLLSKSNFKKIMLKHFLHMWKNAIDHKFQIVLWRSVFSVSSVAHQSHVNQVDVSSINRITTNSKTEPYRWVFSIHILRYIIRCISNTVNGGKNKNISTKYKAMEANLK